MASLPPQRRGGGIGRSGPGGGAGGGRQGAQARGLTPAQGAEEAERRLGKPCFPAGTVVQGLFACVACQFQIRNRRTLPACPECGEIIWAYLESGPRPVPEGESAPPPAAEALETPAVSVQEGVRLDGGPVSVQENVKLSP